MKKKYVGFIEPVIDETHYFAGQGLVPQTVLQPNSEWSDSLPETEEQRKKFETYNCTSFNTLNAIEMLVFKQFGVKVNYSDRWVGIISGTSAKKGGNDPHTVCEAIRKNGLIPEEMLPYSDDLKNVDEYYSFKGANEDACREAGEEWLRQYSFKHEWVFDKSQPLDEKLNNMKVALKYSPLALSVYAWEEENGVYISGGSENHWTSKFAQPSFSKIFDSYSPFIKNVSQNFGYCKRFSIERNVTKENVGGFIEVLKLMLQWLGLLQTPTVAPIAPPSPVQPPITPIVEPMQPKYVWDTPVMARHSLRVICDEEGLSTGQKNILCATVGAESGWKPSAVGKPNKNNTRDWGICQINDGIWIGQGKTFPTTDYVLENPEVCVRWMCKMWKQGHQNWWSAYNNGSFTKYL